MKAENSLDLVKQGNSITDMTPKTDFVEQLAMRSADTSHKRYGNMLVLYESQRVLITLGPDYVCFIVTFIFFAVADFFLVTFVNDAFQKFWVKAFNCSFAGLQLLSYLMIGVSNPGIVLQEHIPSQQTQQSDTETTIRYCLKCKIRMLKNVRHCKTCDVCIRGFDHHCPWTSKCIGGGNMKRFYFFVSLTPFYIIYFMIMIMLSSALNYEKSLKKA